MVWGDQSLSFGHPHPTGVLVNPSRHSMCLLLKVDLELFASLWPPAEHLERGTHGGVGGPRALNRSWDPTPKDSWSEGAGNGLLGGENNACSSISCSHEMNQVPICKAHD